MSVFTINLETPFLSSSRNSIRQGGELSKRCTFTSLPVHTRCNLRGNASRKGPASSPKTNPSSSQKSPTSSRSIRQAPSNGPSEKFLKGQSEKIQKEKLPKRGTKEEPSGGLPDSVARESHKYFDQVTIVVRSGNGGNGAVLKIPRPEAKGSAPGRHGRHQEEQEKKKKKKALPPGARRFNRGSDGEVILPLGGQGGDVVVYADETMTTLLDLHQQGRGGRVAVHAAGGGGNVNGMGGAARSVGDGTSASTLRIPVPVGTVVKRKRGAKLLADLAIPGQEVLVARGGRGGISVLEIPPHNRGHGRPTNIPEGASLSSGTADKDFTIGLPGEEISLELTLRVVADVGLVGLPNAGKSSLLACVTSARPDIADYPFTTLIPNLGRMGGDPEGPDGGLEGGPTLADLPGLIEGAHVGKGLGRMFLRHLRRTSLLVHIVDASAPDPASDYAVLRQELRMYNPQYTQRPHIVALNKMDAPGVQERADDIRSSLLAAASAVPAVPEDAQMAQPQEHQQQRAARAAAFGSRGGSSRGEEPATAVRQLGRLEDSEEGGHIKGHGEEGRGKEADEDKGEGNIPVAIIPISARTGSGVPDLLREIRGALHQEQRSQRQQQSRRGGNVPLPSAQRVNKPQWQI